MTEKLKEWEYKMVERKEGAQYAESLHDLLWRLGRDGWELCTIHNQVYYFKRDNAPSVSGN